MKDLKDLKVGDNVWTIEKGFEPITDINDNNLDEYPIKTELFSYSFDGKAHVTDKHPSLFLTYPFEQQGKWMMVSDNPINEKNKGYKRFVFVNKLGLVLAWNAAETEDEVSKETAYNQWQYAKEIPEPTELILSMQEVADKFGVDVETLKIQK